MKLKSIDVDQFKQLVESCSGPVSLTTADGDQLIASSNLTSRIGLDLVFTVAQQQDITITCANKSDQEKIDQFLNQASDQPT